ncbi:hypothetical protein [Neisseria iguanae]|uniref:Uncharacterized protein n=1 Tax=Neisseria iguanae TaxID=90242 RepID=A0A2P7TYU1_9NEIS|nr:hypothetical protein [Neisseria iguanae]PSJ79889.1 hypothetical protein C7N83_09535 [Neisseria iguanae]
MTEETKKQGVFIIASYDRQFDRERKNKDGTYTKTHYLGFLIRTESGTALCEVRTKNPEKYAHFKRDQVYTLQVYVRGWKDAVYYSDEP